MYYSQTLSPRCVARHCLQRQPLVLTRLSPIFSSADPHLCFHSSSLFRPRLLHPSSQSRRFGGHAGSSQARSQPNIKPTDGRFDWPGRAPCLGNRVSLPGSQIRAPPGRPFLAGSALPIIKPPSLDRSPKVCLDLSRCPLTFCGTAAYHTTCPFPLGTSNCQAHARLPIDACGSEALGPSDIAGSSSTVTTATTSSSTSHCSSRRENSPACEQVYRRVSFQIDDDAVVAAQPKQRNATRIASAPRRSMKPRQHPPMRP